MSFFLLNFPTLIGLNQQEEPLELKIKDNAVHAGLSQPQVVLKEFLIPNLLD